MTKKDAILERRDALATIAHEHGIILMMLYGSVARGTNTRESDVDIAVLGTHQLSFEDEALLAEKIHLTTGLTDVSVHSLNQATPLFASEVMKDGLVLFEDIDGRALAYGLYAWKLAAESRYLRDAVYADTSKKIHSYA